MDPDRGLEADGESTVEDEEHDGSGDAGCMSHWGRVLDLVD